MMLVIYADNLGNNLNDLPETMEQHLKDAIGEIHILPIFPSTGDRGFSPTRYSGMDPKFGTWKDFEKLGEKYYLMPDFMINRISKRPKYYQDFQKSGGNSKYKDLFLDWNEFQPKGRPTKANIDQIYEGKDKASRQEITFADGSKSKLWNTFGGKQIDLDVRTRVTQESIKDSIRTLAKHKASLARLDAFACAIGKLDMNDFLVEPKIWELLDQVKNNLKGTDAKTLPKIRRHYTILMKVAKHGYCIYGLALPVVSPHSLCSGKSDRLAAWFRECPMKQSTTLDTHDGIGVVDTKGVLTDDELEYTTSGLYKVGANVGRKYSSAEYHNLDVYQTNTTYCSALGNDDKKYLSARLLQVLASEVLQIYYARLLASKNDLKLPGETKESRNINRHYYSEEEIAKEVKRSVAQSLIELLKFRNGEAVFNLNGLIEAETPSENEVVIRRRDRDQLRTAEAKVNLKDLSCDARVNDQEVRFW